MKPAFERDSDIAVKPWYSYKGGVADSTLPAFFENTGWNWITEGEKQFADFRNEIETLISKKTGVVQPYFHTSLIQQGKWEVVNFIFWTRDNKENCLACPKLTAWLKTVPGITTAGVSRLSHGAEIKPHIGDTNMIARCHLGLIIPAGLPDCGITVNGETRAWQEGKFTVFCDAYEHSAWNKTDAYRYVLIVDVVLPRFLHRKKQIAANVQSFLKLQALMERKPWVRKLPGPVLGVVRHFYKFFT